MQSAVQDVFNRLRKKVAGVTALLLLGSDGASLGCATQNYERDTELLADELATLLRIARRTSEDTGIGDMTEHIMLSDSAVIVSKLLPSDCFAVFVCKAQDHLGRLRYELKNSAQELEAEIKAERAQSRIR